jgi:drug/metabolite transporter (DMT)-like permease
MNWLSITLFAYFLNAIAMVIDKTLLKKAIKNPFVYTFYIAALGAVLIILAIPIALIFNLELIWPGWSQFWISMAAGGSFSVGLILMYIALKKSDATRLLPMIGGLTPIFVIFLAYFLIGESLILKQIFAFIIIMIGTFLISLEFKNGDIKFKKLLWLALPSALFFALSYVLTKDVYNHQPFISGFVWTRLGALALILLPMILHKNRYDLRHPDKDVNMKKTLGKFLFGQGSGAASAVLVQYAISIASVSLVMALQGTQYVFVFAAVLISTYYFPKFLSEKMNRNIIFQKVLAILIIGAGIYLIV